MHNICQSTPVITYSAVPASDNLHSVNSNYTKFLESAPVVPATNLTKKLATVAVFLYIVAFYVCSYTVTIVRNPTQKWADGQDVNHGRDITVSFAIANGWKAGTTLFIILATLFALYLFHLRRGRLAAARMLFVLTSCIGAIMATYWNHLRFEFDYETAQKMKQKHVNSALLGWISTFLVVTPTFYIWRHSHSKLILSIFVVYIVAWSIVVPMQASEKVWNFATEKFGEIGATDLYGSMENVILITFFFTMFVVGFFPVQSS